MCREAYGFKSRLPHLNHFFIIGKATLKIETVARDDQQTKLIAELDSETLEKYKHQAARKISRSQKIPGFRPGKAPYDLIRRMYGDEALQQEAMELMLDEIYPQAICEANINPSGPGKLEEIVSVDPPTFSFIIPLPPEVNLGEYKEIRKEYAPEAVTDEQIELTLKRLQRSYATAEPVEREAQKGDLVSFKFSAKRTQTEEGENDTLVEETPYQMVAGEKEEEETETGAWPFEGFSDELIGMSVDQVKTFTHTFDDETPYEDLRGKEALFTIEVQSIKEMHLPELNDEFAQTLGQFENLEELAKAVRSQLEQTSSQQYDQNYFDELVDQVVEQADLKYPPHMLDDEIEEFIAGLQKNLERDHLDLETYLKMREMERDAFVEQEVKPAAKRRLERSLVLEEFAKSENVELKNEEIQSIYYSAMQQMQSQEMRKVQAKSKNRQSTQEMANSIAINTVNSIFNQRLMGRLKAIATGKGDEKEAEILAEEETEIAPISEAALDAGESSSVDSEPETQSTIEEQPAVEEQPKSETDENEA